MVVDDNPEETAKRVLQQRELMLLSRPNNVSRAYERVPRPKEGLPTNPLPLWTLMPLDHKVPAVPAPPDTFVITQGELSNGIFYQPQRRCFDTDDPYIQETPIEYDPLHDPHLREHFQHNPLIVKKLIRLGMLTAKGNVRCSLAQLNKYRVYLKRLYNCLINADRANEREWRSQQLDQIKEIRKCTLKIMKEKWNEEWRRRRLKSREEREIRNMLLKKRREEHPSNFIHETRAQEAALRKHRNDQKRFKVYYRLSAMRKADQKRRKMIMLHIMCQEDLTEKLREYLCEERSVNRAADLATFIRDKRKYQEDKLRYHRALLQREDIEKACKIVNRQAEYDLQDLRRRDAAARKVQRAKDKKNREAFLLNKYGKKWMNYVRKARLDAGHASVWHVRNLIRETEKELKLVSGAKSFTSFLRDIMEKKNKELFEGFDMPPPIKFDTDTRRTVKEILDVLVDCSYKEFVRRATSCLVDHVVNEAREKCVSYICRKGFDPGELVEPIIPRRLRNQIRLEPPTHPCSGPCAQFGKSDVWKRKCGKMCDTLGQLHDELSDRLSKKLTDDLQKILDDENALDTMQKKVMDARGSAEMEAAADTVAGIAMDRASTRPANERMQKEFTDYASDRLEGSVSQEDYDRARRYLEGVGLQNQLEKAQKKQKELRKGLGRVGFEGLDPENEPGEGLGSTIESAGPSGASGTSASGKTDTTADGAENLLADSDLGRLSSAIIADLLSDNNELDEANELMGAVDAVIDQQKLQLQRESLAQVVPLAKPSSSSATVSKPSPSTLAASGTAQPTPSTLAATAKPQPTPSVLAASQPASTESAKPSPSITGAAVASEPVKPTPSSIAAAPSEAAKPTPSTIAATSGDVKLSPTSAAETGKPASTVETAKPSPSTLATSPAVQKAEEAKPEAVAQSVKPSPSVTEAKPLPSTIPAAEEAKASPSALAAAQPTGIPEPVQPSPSTIAADQAAEAAKPSPSTLAAAPVVTGPEAIRPAPSSTAQDQAAIAPEAAKPSPSTPATAQVVGAPETNKSSPSATAAPPSASTPEAVKPSSELTETPAKPSPSETVPQVTSPTEPKTSPSTQAAAQASKADDVEKPSPSTVASAEPTPTSADDGAKADDDTAPKAAPEAETALTPSQHKLAEASKAEDVAEASVAPPVTSHEDVKVAESQDKAAISDEKAEKPEAAKDDEATTSQVQESRSTAVVPEKVEPEKSTEAAPAPAVVSPDAETAAIEDQSPEATETVVTVTEESPEPTTSQSQAVPTPSQIQAVIPTSSQLESAQTPSQIQAAAAPSTAHSTVRFAEDQKPSEDSTASVPQAEVGPAVTESQQKLLDDKAAAAEDAAAGKPAEEALVATTPSGTPILDGTGKETETPVTAVQDGEGAGPSAVEPTTSQTPLKEPSSHPPSQTPSQALAVAQAAAPDGSQPNEAQQAQVVGAEGEGPATTPSAADQVVPTDSKVGADGGMAGEGASPEAVVAAIGGEQKTAIPGTVSKSASQMVTTAICSACDKETKLLDGTQGPLQITESERFGKVAEDMADQAIQRVVDGKVVCDDDKAPEAGSPLVAKDSEQVNKDAEDMAKRAIQNVVDGKVVCPDEQGEVLSSTSSIYGIDDISKVGSLITTEAIEAAKLRCGPKQLEKAGRVDDGDGVSLAASQMTNEAVEAAKNLAAGGGEKPKGLDVTAVPQDGDAFLDGAASELIHSAIQAAHVLVQGDTAEGTGQPERTTGEGVQILVPPGANFDTEESLAPTRQSSQLGVSISTVPSRIGSQVSYTFADIDQVDRLASQLALNVLEKCAPDQEIQSRAVPSQSYISIFDESDLSRQASKIAFTAVKTAKDKEEENTKMITGDSNLPALTVAAEPPRPPSRKPQPYAEPNLGRTTLIDPGENDKILESGQVTDSGVEMILYPQMLPPESDIRVNVTPSDIARMVYQLDEDDDSLTDVNYFRFGGRAVGKSDIHTDRTTFASATGGPHGLLTQHMAEPLSRNDGSQPTGDEQQPPPIPPRQGDQRRLGPQSTLTPDVRAHVQAQLLSIRNELADITQALIGSGVMQPRGTPPPPQPPPRES